MAAQTGGKYQFLGRSGLSVSNICLGTMTFGKAPGGHPAFSSPTQLDETKAHEILDRYAALGGNFIDTANMYCFGQSEEIIGSWLTKQKRSNFVIATKCRAKMGDAPNDVGLGRRHIIQMCEDSLRRLQTDYIDLYQTHCWDYAVPLEETLRAFDDLVKAGKVRYIGVSNVNGWQMQKIVDTAKSLGISNVISLQQQYNLLCRHSEWEEFQVCRNEGLGVMVWSPLKGGMLTGKFQRGEKPEDSGSRIGHVHKNEKTAISSCPAWSWYAEDEGYWNLVEIMKKAAANHGKSVPQVALKWLLQKNVVSSVIIGVTSIKQLEDNMAAGEDWCLTQDEMTSLDQATALPSTYPYNQLERMNTGRSNPYLSLPFVENVFK
ncbi:1-deoxyxylulose-5-phosphate synthase YajO-like [Argopecten irradians]|uniref:1-deoxyxylulose-5-phosphate synthase YajO-like n=1 Tax=Argopecten irradians TaxID=31199 RepID=UPI0037140FC7